MNQAQEFVKVVDLVNEKMDGIFSSYSISTVKFVKDSCYVVKVVNTFNNINDNYIYGIHVWNECKEWDIITVADTVRECTADVKKWVKQS